MTDATRARLIWLLDQIEGELYRVGGAPLLDDARDHAKRDADLFTPAPGQNPDQEALEHLRLRLQVLTQHLDRL